MGDPYRQAVAEIATKGNASLAERHANSTSTSDLLEVLAELAIEEQELASEQELADAEGTNTTNANQTNTTKERPRPLPSPLLPGAW